MELYSENVDLTARLHKAMKSLVVVDRGEIRAETRTASKDIAGSVRSSTVNAGEVERLIQEELESDGRKT